MESERTYTLNNTELERLLRGCSADKGLKGEYLTHGVLRVKDKHIIDARSRVIIKRKTLDLLPFCAMMYGEDGSGRRHFSSPDVGIGR